MKKKNKNKKKLRRETFNLHKAWLDNVTQPIPPQAQCGKPVASYPGPRAERVPRVGLGTRLANLCMKRRMITTRVVVFLLGLLACSSRAEIPGLTNRWAVEVRGGPKAANTLARKYGFGNRGQVRYSVIWFSLFSSRSVH